MKYITGAAEIIPFAIVNDKRNVGVHWHRTKVLVTSDSDNPLAAAEELAALSDAVADLEVENGRLEDVIKRLQYAIPPAVPNQLIGTGALREDPDRKCLWLLACSEKGWSAFGIRLDGWDDLFRRYDVVVGTPQQDAWGQWWPAHPRKDSV